MTYELNKADYDEFDSRLVMKIEEGDLDVRVYDTDQIIIFGKEKRKCPVLRANKIVNEEKEVPVKVSLDLRTYEGNYRFYECQGNVGGMLFTQEEDIKSYRAAITLLNTRGFEIKKFEGFKKNSETSIKNYSELSDYINLLKQSKTNKFVCTDFSLKQELSMFYCRAISRPLYLLNPKFIGSVLLGVSPVNYESSFDFSKLRLDLDCLSSDTNYVGTVARLSSQFSSSYGGDELQPRIISKIFNIEKYLNYLCGENKINSKIPSLSNSVFVIDYSLERHREIIGFSSFFFNSFNIRPESLLLPHRHVLYVPASSELEKTIEQIAPLPLD